MCQPDVFNTEAHPFKAPPLKDTYGGGTPAPTPTDPYPYQNVDTPPAQISPNPVLGDGLTKLITDAVSIVGILLGGLDL